ncbi:hypothetical protein F4823DRAFT_634768 [Ustulina deusta]|nr:hypothetical protein F4823DRAFT_634768 [Ustulina deusta]
MDSANQDPPTRLAWIWSPGSDAHICSEASMFKEYTAFVSEITSTLEHGFCKVHVLGVGTVELLVKKSPRHNGPGSHGTILLTDVLHVKDLPFNIIARTSDIGTWNWASNARTNGYIFDREQKRVAYFTPKGKNLTVQQCDLSTGSAVGVKMPQRMDKYKRIISWKKSERERWNSYIRQVQNDATDLAKRSDELPDEKKSEIVPKNEARKSFVCEPDTSDEPPYIPSEKLWLKISFGSEDTFLQIHGLNPHEAEHRILGRKVARAMILDGVKEDESGEEMDHKQGSERPTYSHPDCKFSAKEVEFINKGWGNTVKFMHALRLDLCNREDWKRAKEFVRSTGPRDSGV